ncbi:hypothetical protein C8J57DRAFT_1465395 [Mycena rebaudengoi]|nr:hypothetical protein C8J57DRAFT_1465395 [Mycena rebaudengoi]
MADLTQFRYLPQTIIPPTLGGKTSFPSLTHDVTIFIGGIGGAGGWGSQRGGDGGRGEGARLTQGQAELKLTAGDGQGGRGGASPGTRGKDGRGQRAVITGPLLPPSAPLYEKGYRDVKMVSPALTTDLEAAGLEIDHIRVGELKDALEQASARLKK